MGSILIVQNDYKINLELLELLEKEYHIYVAEDVWEGLNLIEEHYIDTFVMMLDRHIGEEIKRFLKELWKNRSKHTPIVFIAEKPSEELHLHLYKNSSWYFTEYPINYEDFISIIAHSMELADILNDKGIVLKSNRHLYLYKVKNISRIERSKNRYINIYSHNPTMLTEEVQTFYYPGTLQKFLKEYDVEKQIKQAHQSWLVNISDIKEVRITDLELVLMNGTIIPTSKKFIHNFRK